MVSPWKRAFDHSSSPSSTAATWMGHGSARSASGRAQQPLAHRRRGSWNGTMIVMSSSFPPEYTRLSSSDAASEKGVTACLDVDASNAAHSSERAASAAHARAECPAACARRCASSTWRAIASSPTLSKSPASRGGAHLASPPCRPGRGGRRGSPLSHIPSPTRGLQDAPWARARARADRQSRGRPSRRGGRRPPPSVAGGASARDVHAKGQGRRRRGRRRRRRRGRRRGGEEGEDAVQSRQTRVRDR
jgi:hypothetical protein